MIKVRHNHCCRAYSLVGLLITMACIVVLMAIGMTALNKAVTGEGAVKENTVRSVQDKITLTGLFQAIFVYASDNPNHKPGLFITPSYLTERQEWADDTTASLYSAMIMHNAVSPKMLISGNEYNAYVYEDEDYDMTKYRPADDIWWDDAFEADLHSDSNVSFAHIPLFGERYRKHWNTRLTGGFPIIGNRGPKDGVHDPNSFTYGRDGTWAGHIVMGDGSVDFRSGVENARSGDDGWFSFDEPGTDGDDAILSFTKAMSERGPELQFD